MIRLIYGDPGTGKTGRVMSMLKQDAEAGIRSFLIVPEQITVEAELLAAQMLPPGAQLSCEVLNFSRLPNRVFRETGGLHYDYASDTVRRLVMQRAVRQVFPLLREYGGVSASDRSFPGVLLAALDEFKASGVDVEEAGRALASSVPSSPAAAKLADLATVAAAYGAMLAERFSDSADDLSRLADALAKRNFFAGAHVYLDSFQSLTGSERRVLGEIMRQAGLTCVTFSLPSPQSRGIDTVSQRRMSDEVRLAASALGLPAETEILTVPHRYTGRGPELLSSALWRLDAVPDTDDGGERDSADGSVRIVTAADIFDECEEIAAVVRKELRGGLRCRDIAVIARDAGEYRGIIEPEFEKAGIPYYLSEKRPVSASAPARLVISSLRVFLSGWRRDELVTYLRTGLSGVGARDADVFETYTERWNIGGRGFFPDGAWQMNPDGYEPELSPRAAADLETANRVREAVVPFLSAYFEKLGASASCLDMCRATYEFTEELGVRDRMLQIASEELAGGRAREAAEAVRSADALTEVLDSVADAYGTSDRPSLEEYCSALQTAFETVFVGTIPTTPDAVVIGSADMIRTERIKIAVLAGVYDGSFPAPAGRSGLLSEADREALASAGVRLGSDRESRASDELFFVRRAISFASSAVYLFTRGDGRPSVVCERVLSLLPGTERLAAGGDTEARITSPAAAREYLRITEGTRFGASLREALRRTGSGVPGACTAPLDASSDSFSAESADALFRGRIALSQSRLDSYASCPFSFTCRYLLPLRETGPASFSYSSMGSFIHFVLERYLRFVFTENGGVFPEGEQKLKLTEKIAADYVARLAPEGSPQRTARLLHTAGRLSRLARGLLSDLSDELGASSFIPEYFELKLGGPGAPPVSFRLDDGTAVTLSGVADRVDVYRTGGKAYVRVVDYKTGDRTFSLERVRGGESLQLLLYLFAVCSPGGPVRDGDGLPAEPAAASYYSAKIPKLSLAPDAAESDVDRAISEHISRTGIVLDDAEVARALPGDSRFELKNTDALVSRGELLSLYGSVTDFVTAAAKNIRSGRAWARPSQPAVSCPLCPYREICRISGSEGR